VLLADDWLFARFLLVHTEPSFGTGPRPLAWEALKTSLGAEWLINRVKQLPDDGAPEEEITDVVQTAKKHASHEQGSLPAE
jgi:hypothetical protein